MTDSISGTPLSTYVQESPLFKSCCANITKIHQYLESLKANATPRKTSPMGSANNGGEEISWYALLLVVPLSLVGLMLGMTHHVLLFLASICENILSGWCAQWTQFKESNPRPEQYVFFCLLSAPVMMVLASAWVALNVCCHLNRIFLSNVPENINKFINAQLNL